MGLDMTDYLFLGLIFGCIALVIFINGNYK